MRGRLGEASIGNMLRIVLALALVLQAFGWAFGEQTARAEAPAASGSTLDAVANVLQNEELDDWSAFALARAGRTVPQSYLDMLYKEIADQDGKLNPITDAERIALVLKAAGGDPEHAGGHNLIASIAANASPSDSGVMSAIYGLLALNSGSYAISDNAPWKQADLQQWLLDHRQAGAGWSLFGGDPSDVDITCMALTALAPAYKQSADVKKAVDEAVAWLADRQNADGGFGADAAGGTSESDAQAIIALTSLGIDPQSSSFAKGDGLLGHLLGFRQADGGFSHTKGGETNIISIAQALQALTAYRMFTEKQGTLFYHIQANVKIHVRVEGPQSELGEGDVTSGNALSALKAWGENEQAAVEITDSSYGPYVSGIAGIKASGSDGWLFAVKRGGTWVYPQAGMADFELKPADELVVYYGGKTKLVSGIRVVPERPKAGEPFKVAVDSAEWDWTANKEAVGPAAGVRVTVGGVSQTTGKDGSAAFEGFPKEGAYPIEVTGYQTAGAPSIVRAEQALSVISAKVNVSVEVEGTEGRVLSGVVSATDVLDALQQVADRQHVALELKDSSYGKYLNGVGDVKATAADGWLFAVERQGEWIFPQTGMSDFDLRPNDKILVYFGFQAKLVQSVKLSPAWPKAGEPFSVEVQQVSWDWQQNKAVVEPAAGATVQIGDRTVTTGTDGKAAVGGLPNGSYRLAVSGKLANGSPSLVRSSVPVAIFADADQASGWAQSSIDEAVRLGIMEGTGDAEFAPAQPVTRAQFAAILTRLLDAPAEAPATADFADVPLDSWFAGYVHAAKESGIVEGTGDGTFSPDATLTREQTALMLARALKLSPPEEAADTFSDLDTGSSAPASMPFIRAIIQDGLMNGVDDVHFNPQGTVTREMAAVIAVRAAGKIGG